MDIISQCPAKNVKQIADLKFKEGTQPQEEDVCRARAEMKTWLDVVQKTVPFCYNGQTKKIRSCTCLSRCDSSLVANYVAGYCLSHVRSREMLEYNHLKSAVAYRHKLKHNPEKRKEAVKPYRIYFAGGASEWLCSTAYHNLFGTRAFSTGQLPTLSQRCISVDPTHDHAEPKMHSCAQELSSKRKSSTETILICHESKKRKLMQNPVLGLTKKQGTIEEQTYLDTTGAKNAMSGELQINHWIDSLKETIPFCYNPATRLQKKKCRCLSNCEAEQVAKYMINFCQQDAIDRARCIGELKSLAMARKQLAKSDDVRNKSSRAYHLRLSDDQLIGSFCRTGFDNLFGIFVQEETEIIKSYPVMADEKKRPVLITDEEDEVCTPQKRCKINNCEASKQKGIDRSLSINRISRIVVLQNQQEVSRMKKLKKAHKLASFCRSIAR